MAIKIPTKCEYEGCDKDATRLAQGREDYLDEGDPAHPGVHGYCEEHASKVADEGFPEYARNYYYEKFSE